jgi:hypothetical protein
MPPPVKCQLCAGFHEAVGDVIALSVLTPKHLREVGLLERDSSAGHYETTINYLFLQGLQKVVFLPFAYLLDLWRWGVFKGQVTSKNYNCEWWKLRFVCLSYSQRDILFGSSVREVKSLRKMSMELAETRDGI